MALHGMQAVYTRKSCPCVCLSNAWVATKRKEVMHSFLYHMNERLSQFFDTKNVWWRTTLPKILGQIYLRHWKNGNFQSTFARSASPILSSERMFSYHLQEVYYSFSYEPKMNIVPSYVLPMSPEKAKKSKIAAFRLKIDISRIKSATTFFYVKTVIGKVVRHLLAYLSVHKWLAREVPFYMKISVKMICPLPCKNGDFQSIFTRRISAVIPSEKSLIMINRKSTKSFPASLG